jgi:hypothetical protein
LQCFEHGRQSRLEYALRVAIPRAFLIGVVIGIRGAVRVNCDLHSHGVPVVVSFFPFSLSLFAVQIGLEVQIAVEVGVHPKVNIAHDTGQIEFAQCTLRNGRLAAGSAEEPLVA